MRLPAIMIIALAALWLPLPAAAEEAAKPEAPAAAPADAAKQPAEPAAAEEPTAPEKAKPALTLAPEDLPGGATSDNAEPLNLEADQIVYEGEGFTCTGNVLVTRGVTKIECEKIAATLADVEKEDKVTGEKTKAKSIKTLVATGSPIKMESTGRKAQCLKIVYELSEGKVTLTGSPEFVPTVTDEKGRTASGEPIIYMINEKRWIFGKEDSNTRSRIQIPAAGGMPNIMK